MNHLVPHWRRLATALAAILVAAGSAAAQSSYPYWGAAPQSYSGSQVTVPVPGMSPSAVSNASQAPPSPTGSSFNIGGGYIPPVSSRPETKAHIWLRVPKNAEIWVNGVKTKQTGDTRYFFSPALAAGKKYSYQVRVRWTQDGKPVDETQTILVHAGATIHRDFTHSDKTEPRP